MNLYLGVWLIDRCQSQLPLRAGLSATHTAQAWAGSWRAEGTGLCGGSGGWGARGVGLQRVKRVQVERLQGARGAGGVGLEGVRDPVLGALAGPCPGRAPPAAGGVHIWVGRSAHLGGAGRGGAGRAGSDFGGAGVEHPTAAASGVPSPAEPRPCPSVPAARRRSTSVRASCPSPAAPTAGDLSGTDAAPRRAVGPPGTPASGCPHIAHPISANSWGIPELLTPALWVPGVPRVGDPVDPPPRRCLAALGASTAAHPTSFPAQPAALSRFGDQRPSW